MDDCDAWFSNVSPARMANFATHRAADRTSLRSAEDSCSRRSRRALIKEDVQMKRLVSATMAVGLLAWFTPVAQAQTPGEVFRKVAPSVVVIRAKGRDIGAGGQSRFAETGSGVLISPDGKVMTGSRRALDGRDQRRVP